MKDCYKTLFDKICKIKRLNNDEIKNAENELNNKFDDIVNYRNYLNDECKEYTSFSYFFIIYEIILKNMENKLEYEEFQSGNHFENIRNIITNKCIEYDICSEDDELKFVEKYEECYKIIINKELIIDKSHSDIAREEFWKIIDG